MTSGSKDASATIHEASADALYHGLVELPDGATLVGVVRRPTRAVRAVVDENYPELGLPEALLDDFTAARDDLKMQGLCEEGAHNAAWEHVSVERRYAAYLDESEAPREALEELRGRRDDGEGLVLVAEEGEKKRSHRSILRDRL